MTSPPSDHSAGSQLPEDEGPPAPTEAHAESRDDIPTKPPPPLRRQTMEVQMAWLAHQPDEPRIEQVVISTAPEEETPKTKSVSPISDALQSDTDDMASAFPEQDAPTVPRRWPPRLPGADRSLPPMPVRVSTKPPVPPRRPTTEVKMEWVELVDDDLVEDESGRALPAVRDEPADEELEGPPISESVRAARARDLEETAERPALDDAELAEAAKEADKKERLSQFLQAVSGSVPPSPHVSDVPPVSTDADLDKMREEALADRKREQDARDREILAKRRIERERERVEEEARRAASAEKLEEDERRAAIRQGTPDGRILDLSGSDVDHEIDDALDSILGPNLSYPPAPPSDDEK